MSMHSIERLIQEEGGDVDIEFLRFLHDDAVGVNRKFWVTLLDHHSTTELRPYSDICRLIVNDDVDAILKWELTPLHFALQNGADLQDGAELQVIQGLLDDKVDTAAADRLGQTALHYALGWGADVEVVQTLINHKADVNAACKDGRRPLHSVCYGDRIKPSVMQLMLSHGADVFARDHAQKTSLHYLVDSDCIEAVKVFFDHLQSNNDESMVVYLLTSVDNMGRFPFHYVHSVEMAILLLEQTQLKDDEAVVSEVCLAMLYAKDGRGHTVVDLQTPTRRTSHGRALLAYFESYCDLPLTAPQATMPCEHRDQRQRLVADEVGVRINPILNNIQCSVAEAFASKWKGWSTLFQPEGAASASPKDLQYLLPDDLKYPIMSYLSSKDAMWVGSTQ